MSQEATVSEHGISGFLVVLVFLYGWIRSFEVVQTLTLRDVAEVSSEDGFWGIERIMNIAWRLFLPYTEIWMLIIAGIIMLFVVDKIFVTIVSMRDKKVTIGDSYATRIFLACFKQWQILIAIIMSLSLIMGCTVAFLFWMRMQDNPDEKLLARGLELINIYGMIIALNIIFIQSFISRPGGS